MAQTLLRLIVAVAICLVVGLVPWQAAAGVLFESKSYSDGEYRGIQIGASKNQVLETLRGLRVFGLKPIPTTQFEITRTNRSDLHLVATAEGIRVFNYRGLAINVLFDGDAVTRVEPSVPARDLSWINVGDSRSQVIARLDNLLVSQEGLEVIPIADGAFVKLAGANSSDLEALKKHDAWMFELNDEKPAGAMVEVVFREGRLARLDYKRARFPK